ncbi:MAG: 30S ribosomal protein S16 [Bacteroidota bacterium]|nr:30S ribosomal protein S16 [Bacteroidota bacterium]
MSVKIRLSRKGRKKLALFDVVIADSRYPRDGKFIEKIGIYNPNTNPATIELQEDKAFEWLMKGATPTDTVKAMLSYKGLLYKKHLQVGVNKGAITQEDADKKLQAWIDNKIGKIESKKNKLADQKSKSAKARLEAEIQVNAAREEAIKNKNKVVETVEPTAEAVTETATVAEVAIDSVPVVENVVETAPVVENVVETAPVVEVVAEAASESTPDAVAPEEEAPKA